MDTMTRLVAMAAVVAMTACGGTAESVEMEAFSGGEKSDDESQVFTVSLDRFTTAENVIPQILSAGRDQLAPLCEERPDASISIFLSLASGARTTDVPCSSILVGDETIGEATNLLTSNADGPIGEAQQPIGPISLIACGVASIGTSLFTRYGLCPRAATEQDRRKCTDVGLWGSAGITVLCMIPL